MAGPSRSEIIPVGIMAISGGTLSMIRSAACADCSTTRRGINVQPRPTAMQPRMPSRVPNSMASDDRVTEFALPGDGPGAVGAAFAEQDQRQQHRVGAGGMYLHQFLDDQFLEAQVGVDDRAGDEGAIELVVEHLLGQRAGGVGEDAHFQARMGWPAPPSGHWAGAGRRRFPSTPMRSSPTLSPTWRTALAVCRSSASMRRA